MTRRNPLLLVLFIVAALVFSGCAHAPDRQTGDLTMTIAHVNDTHSHLDPAEQTLMINGVPTKVQLGGFARLKSAVDELRSREANVLLLHGGDMVQGTFYFIKYQGQVDSEFLNLLGIDAACSGNHEFDKGPGLLAGMIERATFPIVSANIDVSREPLLAGKLMPHTVIKVAGHKIGIIGLTTPETAAISNPGPNVRFLDPAESVMRSVVKLHEQGIRKIIVLSHLGYEDDIAVAKKISGVSIIVGGNSHTLLGDARRFGMLGLTPAGEYPTLVPDRQGRKVLIVQSWEWAKALGELKVTLDDQGNASAWSGNATLIAGNQFKQKGADVPAGSTAYESIRGALTASGVARIHADNPDFRKRLDVYSQPIQELLGTVIGRTDQELKRVNNAGPGALIADAMLWKTRSAGAMIAIQNSGGVRKDVPAGDITIGGVYELMPFGNTLVVLDLSGRELRESLEEAIDYQMAAGNKEPYLYVAGMHFRLDREARNGKRVNDIKVVDRDGSALPLDESRTYRVVVNNYLADGGDGMKILKRATGYRNDTGFSDAEVFMEYLKQKGTISNPTEKRISIRPLMPRMKEMKKAA